MFFGGSGTAGIILPDETPVAVDTPCAVDVVATGGDTGSAANAGVENARATSSAATNLTRAFYRGRAPCATLPAILEAVADPSRTKPSELRVTRNRVVDMSPAAIAQRLAQLEQLFQLALSLSKARRIDNVEDDPEKPHD